MAKGKSRPMLSAAHELVKWARRIHTTHPEVIGNDEKEIEAFGAALDAFIEALESFNSNDNSKDDDEKTPADEIVEEWEAGKGFKPVK